MSALSFSEDPTGSINVNGRVLPQNFTSGLMTIPVDPQLEIHHQYYYIVLDALSHIATPDELFATYDDAKMAILEMYVDGGEGTVDVDALIDVGSYQIVKMRLPTPARAEALSKVWETAFKLIQAKRELDIKEEEIHRKAEEAADKILRKAEEDIRILRGIPKAKASKGKSGSKSTTSKAKVGSGLGDAQTRWNNFKGAD